ncbi:TPA: BrnT family toxin, partial [Mannheimia haemolytica]|nr:BrnT family toxin [Mannheimia haemolytica]
MYIDLQYAVPLLFEYDPNKSQINLAKYGIDFEQAK